MSAPPSSASEPRLRRQIFLTPGTLYCSDEPIVVATVLGSCVAVCLIDRQTRAAGMNHYVLPDSAGKANSLRHGDVALARLAEKMDALGCRAADLQAKVFGGAAVLPFGASAVTIGTKNVQVALDWLKERSIPVIARRTGGTSGLQIRLYIGSGRVLVRKIESSTTGPAAIGEPTHDSRHNPAVKNEG
jgi:chemotaxis protein CheD